jgi:hypothetical protein
MIQLLPRIILHRRERSHLKITAGHFLHRASLPKSDRFFDFFFEDRQLNVDAAAREVRPPGAPTNWPGTAAVEFRLLGPGAGDQSHRYVVHDRDNIYSESVDRTIARWG